MFKNFKLNNFFNLGIHLGGQYNQLEIPKKRIFALRNQTLILNLNLFLADFKKLIPYLNNLFLNKNKVLFISPSSNFDWVIRKTAIMANQPYVYYFPGVLSNQDMNYSFIKNQNITKKWSLNLNYAFIPVLDSEILKELNSLYIPTICVVNNKFYEKITFPIFGNTLSKTRWYFYSMLMSFLLINLQKITK